MSVLAGQPVVAATDITNAPLATQSDTAAKPNIMFILDNSGSMASPYMPDDMSSTSNYGYWSPQCNGVAYNENLTYAPPVASDGTSYPNMSFAAAWDDGFAPGPSTTTTSSTSAQFQASGNLTFSLSSGSATSYATGDLVGVELTADTTRWMAGTVTAWNSTTRQLTLSMNNTNSTGTFNAWTIGKVTTKNLTGSTYYRYSGTQTAMNWTYTASGVITSTTFFKECMSAIGSTPGSSVFSLVTMDNTQSTAKQQNYANWYSYYRTRLLMMRSAAGKSFTTLSNNYRVGFTVISDTGVTQGTNKFVDVADFDATQKSLFYASLYSATGNSNTPLRGALSKVGRYFGNAISGQKDPMQYSCQRNYAILSTDGYWNTGSETPTYTSLQLDGKTLVGQQDGNEARPMKDATASVSTVTSTTKETDYNKVQTTKTNTRTWTRYQWSIPTKTGVKGCSGYSATIQPQQGTQTSTTTSTKYQNVPKTTVITQVKTNGVITSDNTPGVVTLGTAVDVTSDPDVTTPLSPTTVSYQNAGKSSSTCLTTLPSGVVAGGTYYSSSATSIDNNAAGTSSDSTGAPSAPTSTFVSYVLAPTTTVTSVDSLSGGSSDSLADIAEYYYITDLRNSSLGNCTGSQVSGQQNDVCSNDIVPTGQDSATWQHMNTFTIGLGVNGTLTYDRNYLTQTSGTYVQLTNGTLNWPNPTVSSGGGDATNVDDLWHAAVNGRGQYFAAQSATQVADAISTSLAAAKATVGAGGAAATNSLKPVSGDNNEAFIASYKTVEWTGDVVAHPLDPTTGNINTSVVDWSAQSLLDKAVPANRVIYYRKPASTTLKAFLYANLSADGLGSYFSGFCSQSSVPTQCGSFDSGATPLSPTQLSSANDGNNLVNFLRGDKTYEASSNTTYPLYRTRAHVLGDIVDASPAYVAKPPFSYGDTGYAAFVNTNANRAPMLYVAANDGMLHAFSAANDGTGGSEVWAFVPTAVMPTMYKLADTAYSGNHQFFVDGTPVIGDVFAAGQWRSILVGGLSAGGKSYYAVDVTDPKNPQALWEFTNANLGLTFGNPIITKQADGTWIVVVTSGYNNTTGDGVGHLYVLNAVTGALLKDISTGVGTPASPSGLARISAWVDDPSNNTATRFYGGDLLGNLWRFDTDNLIPPSGNEATQLALFQLNSTTPQPITTAPQPALVTDTNNATYPVVLVGTGRYLGASDIEDATQQSIYAIKDTLAATGWGDVRKNPLLISKSVTPGTASSTINDTPKVDWSADIGWSVDLPSSRERIVTDIQVQFNTVAAASAIPGTTACTPSGGKSWLYLLDLGSGSGGSQLLGDFLAVGMTWLQTTSGSTAIEIVGSDTTVLNRPAGMGGIGGGKVRRTSWRELVN
jgi:type IV pilus assembly protein PilY1